MTKVTTKQFLPSGYGTVQTYDENEARIEELIRQAEWGA